MKTLIVLNGPMGVGKTTVGKELCRRLTPSIFLDGDWCWDLHPFSVTDATKALVMDNIRALLRRDLDCPEVDYVVFVWVLQQEETAAALLDGLDEKARIPLPAGTEGYCRRSAHPGQPGTEPCLSAVLSRTGHPAPLHRRTLPRTARR